MMRFSPTSGTTSASVPIAAIFTNAGSQADLPGPRAERLHQLQRDADAGEVLVGIGAVVPLRVDDRAAHRGSSVSGSWWSVMIRSRPSSRARRAASAPRMPQSTETTSLHAFGVQAIDRRRLQAVAVASAARE